MLASGSCDKVIRLWNLSKGSVSHWHQTPEIISSLQFSNNGDKLVVGLVNGVCQVYEYFKGEQDYKLRHI